MSKRGALPEDGNGFEDMAFTLHQTGEGEGGGGGLVPGKVDILKWTPKSQGTIRELLEASNVVSREVGYP